MKVDFDAEDDRDEDDVPMKMKKSLLDSSDGMSKDILALEGLDGLLEKDKLSTSPLVIDGLEVDREVRDEGII